MRERALPEVRSRRDLTTAAENHGAKLDIVDCQSLDRERMVMTLDLAGSSDAVQQTIVTLRNMTGVSQAYEVSRDSDNTRVIITLEKPRICQSSDDDPILCVDCPFDSAEVPSRWLSTRRASSKEELLSRLGDEGPQVRIDDISPSNKAIRLTLKEKGIVAVAVERGYFDFPRRITLEGLSQLVGVEPASLIKILRSVE